MLTLEGFGSQQPGRTIADVEESGLGPMTKHCLGKPRPGAVLTPDDAIGHGMGADTLAF